MKLLLVVSISGVIVNLIIVSYISSPDRSYEKALPPPAVQASQNSTVGELVDNVDSPAPPKPASPGIPILLKIPKIGVNAAIESVGLTPDGAVATSKGPADVTWYDLGPRPGDEGSAVITGHYGLWKNGEGSVFDDLSKMSPGDKIYVEDDKGVTISFVVRKLRIYDRNENVPEVFNPDDGKAHLNLITCNGVWIKALRTYSNRLIVFADKETEL